MKYLPQIIELADGTKCVRLEDFLNKSDEAKEAIRALAEHGESEIQRITKERDEARRESLEQARLLGISGEWGCKLIAERDELQKKYDKLATENMLEVNKLCNQRDEAINALMKIEDIFIDGDDTYEDWKSMGQLARTFLENIKHE
jgi:hypothetical protein